MSEKILARDLRAGDWISSPDGLAVFHRVPQKRDKTFTAHYGKGQTSYPVTYEPDEEIEVHFRWPFGSSDSW